MSIINQNSILNSVHEALIPGASLIDGRTEEDWLRFLSDFAALINFYEQDNTVHGNWEPFLLKDPVFLMASISRTDSAKIYTLYLRTCHKLEQLLLSAGDHKDLPVSFNQLFDQLTRVFMRIKQWTAYMQMSAIGYPLKTYVIRQIGTTFANYLQAIISLRQELFSSSIITGVVPTDPVMAASFEGYDGKIWKENQFQPPYWEILGLKPSIKDNPATAIFKALTNAGEAVFDFLKIIIQQAGAEFNRLTKLKSSYPDTTLLRTFIHLLKIQQEQLNEIAGKHLSFYYKNILKQTERAAVADQVYVIASLLKKDLTLKLPAGTLFDAGTDAQKNAVIFESTEDVVLNPAAIPVVYTLSRVPGSNGLNSLQLQTITNPGVVSKDTEGKTLSWDTLGSRVPAAATPTSAGIAFASPMLLLREGTRKITLSLGYTGDADLNMIQQASCFLSTLNDWYAVSTDIQLAADPSAGNSIVITVTLKDTDPPIERFLVNPDGIDGFWPMFKLVFPQITVPAITPPLLHSMQIDVVVSGIETFQLYNDYGALSTKVAYPPFGPSPLDGSNFIIGSNEVFSKPLSALTVQLKWSVLPPDFSVYYQAYNLYLNNQLQISKTLDIHWWEKIFGKKKPAQPAIAEETGPYNNNCFTVDFQVLEAQSWTPLVFTTVAPATNSDPLAGSNLLFIADEAKLSTLSKYSATDIPAKACDPSLQNQPLKFTEISTAGFMKMELTGPEYGFGSGIYPNVVSAVTLYNSQALYGDENVTFVTPAQLPFAPKLKSFSADYSASVHYIFDQSKADPQNQAGVKDYPVQCFLYAPFGNYVVYDNQKQPQPQEYTIGSSGAAEKDPSGVLLYATFNYDGFLYLQIDNLLPASSFNLYFELARKYMNGSPADNQVGYYYLATTGWEPLTVLSDGTHNLTCSGIVSVNVPADITMESRLMPGKSYWMAVAANDISAVANTVLLSTNGIEVQRSGTLDTDALTVPGNAITRTKNVIPQISTLEQPFPSFGGRAAEEEKTMNQRISNSIKTKGRAITATDYFSLIQQEFRDIYDVTSIYDPTPKITNVYVVRSVDSQTAPNAFLPLVSSSEEEQIRLYLQQRTSAFSVIRVSNPQFQQVTVYACISIQPGYEFSAVQQRITQSLNIYLSPWIKDSGAQVRIYEEITDVQVSAFIKTVTGVATVESVSFKTWMYGTTENNAMRQLTVVPLEKQALFISNMVHQISLNSSVS